MLAHPPAHTDLSWRYNVWYSLEYPAVNADGKITVLDSLVFWARFWGTIDEWQQCFPCTSWCSATCFNLNEAWEAVIREQERTKLRSEGYYPESTA